MENLNSGLNNQTKQQEVEVEPEQSTEAKKIGQKTASIFLDTEKIAQQRLEAKLEQNPDSLTVGEIVNNYDYLKSIGFSITVEELVQKIANENTQNSTRGRLPSRP